ncbi:MAG TPA: tetraacyldisaccharide 4'-kinase, partial [Pyrinomonadaceae bacterium]|nr:tetraacyldisaccharide 4'-kinase [Pyrinomonadaceae bacterium]
GFQHLRVARDLDLVAVDATNPWGGGHLLPRGRLREPLRELARADLIIITRTEQAERDVDSIRKQAERFSGGRPVILSRTKTRGLRPLGTSLQGSRLESAFHSLPEPVAAFCALGNPTAFFTHIQRDGHQLSFTRAFPDHHLYTQADVDKLICEARLAGALSLLTTAKDAVKLRALRFELPCYVLEIELEFDDAGRLSEIIREAITAARKRV